MQSRYSRSQIRNALAGQMQFGLQMSVSGGKYSLHMSVAGLRCERVFVNSSGETMTAVLNGKNLRLRRAVVEDIDARLSLG